MPNTNAKDTYGYDSYLKVPVPFGFEAIDVRPPRTGEWFIANALGLGSLSGFPLNALLARSDYPPQRGDRIILRQIKVASSRLSSDTLDVKSNEGTYKPHSTPTTGDAQAPWSTDSRAKKLFAKFEARNIGPFKEVQAGQVIHLVGYHKGKKFKTQIKFQEEK